MSCYCAGSTVKKKKEGKEKNKIPLDLLILSIRFCVPYSAVGASIDSFLFLKGKSFFSLLRLLLYPLSDGRFESITLYILLTSTILLLWIIRRCSCLFFFLFFVFFFLGVMEEEEKEAGTGLLRRIGMKNEAHCLPSLLLRLLCL